MKRGKVVKPVKMWAIFDSAKPSTRIDGTLELYRSATQARALLRDVADSGFSLEGVTVARVLVSPLSSRKRARKVK